VTSALFPPFDAGFGIYVHWPFCASKCPYCDFNSHVRAEAIDEPRFARAFDRELASQAALAPGRRVDSIFFGGGTPSLMQPRTIASILESISRYWSLAPDVEITMEANPTSIEATRLAGYRSAGVNRISIGVQSLHDADLRRLGRLHSADEARRAIQMAASVFDRYSFDLIYARPDQTVREWERELREALSLAAEHLSLYQLTIEPGTVFEKLVNARKLTVMDDDAARDLFDVTQEVCAAFGLPAYEVSNHARPGSECRHNLVYWRYGEYVGVGPGAHARLYTDKGRLALSTEKHPEQWLSLVEAQGHATVSETYLESQDEASEFVLMGLRLREGILPEHYHALSGRVLNERQIALLRDDGFLSVTPKGAIAATQKGVPVLNTLIEKLLVS